MAQTHTVEAVPWGGNGGQTHIAYPGGVGNPGGQGNNQGWAKPRNNQAWATPNPPGVGAARNRVGTARKSGAATGGSSVLSLLAIIGLMGAGGFALYLFAFGGYEALFGPKRITLDSDAFVQVIFADPNTDVAAANAFVKAAQTWSDMLNSTVVTPDENSVTTFNEICSDLPSTVAFPNVAVIDRVFIVAFVASDDGPGGTLASAGPCGGVYLDIPANGFEIPGAGVMTFDEDDVDNLVAANELEDVILHEMAHVLGFGTLWDIRDDFSFLGGADLVENEIYNANGFVFPNNDPEYTGTEGMAGRVEVGGSSLAPVEVEDGSFLSLSNLELSQGFGLGSVDSHWMENIYGNELMTPAITGTVRPLSLMTARAIRDLGYTVDTSSADSYSFTSTSTGNDGTTAQKSASDARDGHFTVLANDTFHDPAIPFVLSKRKEHRRLVEKGRRRLGGPSYSKLGVEAVKEFRELQALASK